MIRLQSCTLLLAILLLASCTDSNRQENTATVQDSTGVTHEKKVARNAAGDHYLALGEDSVLIAPFEITIKLSPKAEERMKQGNETIIVHVCFDGDPKDSSKVKLAEDDSFMIACAEKEIHYGERVRFDNIRFSRKVYDQLADDDMNVGLDVYSGRKSSPDNLLNCEPLFGKISQITNKQFTLTGKLIYGDD